MYKGQLVQVAAKSARPGRESRLVLQVPAAGRGCANGRAGGSDSFDLPHGPTYPAARGRTIMLAEIARAKTELRAESLALYRAIIAEPKASNRDKIKAQERIDKLLALEISQAEMYVAMHPEAAKTDDQSSITSEQRAAGLRAEILGELAKRGVSLETGRPPGNNGNGQAG